MPTAPYDIVNTIRLAAEARLNGIITTLQPVSGQLLKNSQPFSQQITNNSWRKLQEFLAELKYSGIEQEASFLSVPGATTTDPLVQVSISYAGYYDGTNTQANPVLPQNFIRPYRLSERASGTQALMTDMDEIINGLPKVPKMNWNRQWEWRDDVLYMPGALVNTDIVMRFGQFFGDFLDISANPGPNQVVGPWYVQPVPIMRCLDAFADYMCREIFYARGDMDAVAAVQPMAEASARLLASRDTLQAAATFKTSEYGKMRDRYTPMKGGVKPVAEP